MKAILALIISCSSLVTCLAQEKKENSDRNVVHRKAVSPNENRGKPRAFVSDTYCWYQPGKVRVFFSSDFAQALGPVGDQSDYNDGFQETLGRLFRSGTLNGEMFYDSIGELSPAVSHISPTDEAL